jgi:hypothetical protein
MKKYHCSSLGELNDNLMDIFESEPTPDSPMRGRDRYVEALRHIAGFMSAQEFDPLVVQNIHGLTAALGNLDRGFVAHFLKPTNVGGTGSSIAPEKWAARALIVIAFDVLIADAERSGRSMNAVADYLIKYSKDWIALLDLDSPRESIVKWWGKMKGGKSGLPEVDCVLANWQGHVALAIEDVVGSGKTATPENVAERIMDLARAQLTLIADKEIIAKSAKALKRS